MSFVAGLRKKFMRLYHGYYTPKEALLLVADAVGEKFFGRNKRVLYAKSRAKRLLRPDKNSYHIGEAYLPLLDVDDEYHLAVSVIGDTFGAYLMFDDKYDEDIVDICDLILVDGLYGLVNDKVNVTVESGDIVIDAGSWIGDFAAYASMKGATVYAFEPTDTTFAILQKTATLNKNIIPVRKGLSDNNSSATLLVSADGNSEANRLLPDSEGSQESQVQTVETVRLDDFVRENNIPRVDFIKSDVEGFERYMLAGAQETLARFAPKLALSTYHLPDDPQIMADLIKQANPKYNIVQKHRKLFASVPE